MRGDAFGLDVAAQIAAADARLTVEGTGDDLGWERREQKTGAWLAEIVADFLQGIADGKVRPCPHISPRTPSAAWLILASRDRIVCASCAQDVLWDVIGTIEDDRCDNCGIPYPVLETFCVAMGGLIVTGGVCRDCKPRVQGSPGGEA